MIWLSIGLYSQRSGMTSVNSKQTLTVLLLTFMSNNYLLQFNTFKCKVMEISSKRSRPTYTYQVTLTINGHPLQYVDYCKYISWYTFLFRPFLAHPYLITQQEFTEKDSSITYDELLQPAELLSLKNRREIARLCLNLTNLTDYPSANTRSIRRSVPHNRRYINDMNTCSHPSFAERSPTKTPFFPIMNY